MKLFRKEKKKCCCEDISEKTIKKAQENKKGIKILGSGCKKCMDLEKAVLHVVEEMHLTLPVEHIQDFATIASYGVMSTPALVIDGTVVAYGKVLKEEEIKALFDTY